MLTLPFRLEILVLTLAAWTAGYFLVNRRVVAVEQRIDLSTAFDGRIPFVPQFALVYFSTYLFVVQPFFLLSDARQFARMLVSFLAISAAASLVHAVLPSKIERRDVAGSRTLSGRLLHLFQNTCRPYGNFPSLHVGLCVPVVISNFLVGGVLLGSIALVWAVLIALSTLFTKQHYILDVLAGLLGGLLIFALTFWLIKPF
jgi:membrane-associated phospholipid phosphatase